MEKLKYFLEGDSLIVFNVSTIELLRFRGKIIDKIPKMLPENYTERQLKNFIDAVNAIQNENARNQLLRLTNTYHEEVGTGQRESMVISFAPIHKCNLRCKYCFADGGRNYQGKEREIDRKTLEKIFQFVLNEYAPACKDLLVNLVSGGEPFLGLELCTHINKIINSINPNIKRKIYIATNLTMFNNEIEDYLKLINPQLGISIDGNQAMHDANRVYEAGGGSYEKVRENLLKLKGSNVLSAKTKDCLFMTVVTEDNLDLVEVLKHHKELQATGVQMKVARETNYGNKGISEKNIEKFENAYERLAEFLLDECKKDNFEYLKMILNTTDYFGKFIRALMLGEANFYRCGAGRDKLSFNAEGDIYPCDNFMGNPEFKLGNIFEGGIIDQRFFGYNVDMMETCSKCWARHVCSGDCHFNAYIKTRDVTKPSPVMCRFYKKIITLAIKLIIGIQAEKPEEYRRLRRSLEVRSRNNAIQ